MERSPESPSYLFVNTSWASCMQTNPVPSFPPPIKCCQHRCLEFQGVEILLTALCRSHARLVIEELMGGLRGFRSGAEQWGRCRASPGPSQQLSCIPTFYADPSVPILKSTLIWAKAALPPPTLPSLPAASGFLAHSSALPGAASVE